MTLEVLVQLLVYASILVAVAYLKKFKAALEVKSNSRRLYKELDFLLGVLIVLSFSASLFSTMYFVYSREWLQSGYLVTWLFGYYTAKNGEEATIENAISKLVIKTNKLSQLVAKTTNNKKNTSDESDSPEV